MLAQTDAGRRRGNRPERPAIIVRRIGLHVPHVEMGCAAAEKEQVVDLARGVPSWSPRRRNSRPSKGQTGKPRSRGDQHRTATER